MSPKQGFPLLSNCSTEKAVRRLTIKEQIVSLHSCTDIKLLRGKFSPVISWGCQLGSQHNWGWRANTNLSHRKAKLWFNFLIVSGKEKKPLYWKKPTFLISTLIFSVEGLKSVTTSDPSGTQSPGEDPVFQLDSMWNQARLLQCLQGCHCAWHWQTTMCTEAFLMCKCWLLV